MVEIIQVVFTTILFVQPLTGDLLPGFVSTMNESSIMLAGEPFSKDESRNIGMLKKWLDDVFWSDYWYDYEARNSMRSQLLDLAELSESHMPGLAFGVGQTMYSYFWFKDNGPVVDLEVALFSLRLHEIGLNYSGCLDLTMTVGEFLGNACHHRWIFTIMLNAEIGAEVAVSRSEVRKAARLLQTADDMFRKLMPYPFYSFRNWNSLYDINTNSDVFDGNIQQSPVWPNEAIPLAGWLEAHAHIFKEDLEVIIQNNIFDTLYFQGRVSMTQFSPRRESWAPLYLMNNKLLAQHVCAVANRTCELLLTRPEIAQCNAKDAGMAFARLKPGYGIKPHFWTAPPRLGIHLGLITPPGATMEVGGRHVVWEEGRSVVFDDTYIHSVEHTGKETRYLLIGWFCHPCDDVNAVPASDPMGLCQRQR